LFQAEQIAMLRTETPDESFQRQLELSSAIKPRTMNSIARPINVAAPHSLKTEQDVAANLGAHSFQLPGKFNRRFATQARDRSEWPLGVGPVVCGNKLCVASSFDYPARQAFQVGLSATRRRIASPDKSDRESFRHLYCHFD
jgi:hypothetical protein